MNTVYKTICLENVNPGKTDLQNWFYLNVSKAEYNAINNNELDIKENIKKYLNIPNWDGSWENVPFSFWTLPLYYYKQQYN